MSKGVKIGLIAGLIIIGLVLLYLVIDIPGKGKRKELTKDKAVSWKASYENDDKNPYGTYIFWELLRKNFKDRGRETKTIEKDLNEELDKNDSKRPDIYVLVTDRTNLFSSEVSELKDFVKKGNYAFISAETFNSSFADYIEQWYYVGTRFTDTLFTNFNYPEYRSENDFETVYYWQEKPFSHPFKVLEELFYDEEDTDEEVYSEEFDSDEKSWEELLTEEELAEFAEEFLPEEDPGESGFNQVKILEETTAGDPVFIRIDEGKGAFFIHTNPLAFTNISMLKERNVMHVERTMAHLPDGNLIWDHYGQLKRKDDSGEDNGGDTLRQSPLQFILREPALRWAYFLTLATLLIYVLSQTKRRQRPVPALEKNENSAMDFADTVTKLYIRNGNNHHILAHQKKLFFSFIRERYFLNFQEADEKVIQMISKKSGIEEEKVRDLVQELKLADIRKIITDKELINTYQKTEYFYKNCR